MAETSTTKKRKDRAKKRAASPNSDHVEIDKSNLDDEFIGHPDLIYQEGLKQAEVQKDIDHAVNELKAIESRSREEIAESREKTTERALDSLVHQHEDVVQARQQLADLEYKLASINAKKSALYEKGRAMQSLVDLLKMNYYAPTGR